MNLFSISLDLTTYAVDIHVSWLIAVAAVLLVIVALRVSTNTSGEV